MLVENSERKLKYESQMSDLEYYLDLDSSDEDELSWMGKGMYYLSKFLYDNRQYMDVEGETQIQIVPRVVKVNNYVSNPILDMKHVPYVLFIGLYCLVDIYYIPVKLFKKLTRGSKNSWVLSPENYGLPSIEDVEYSTMKLEERGTHYIALSKNSTSGIIAQSITSINNYDIIY